MSSGGVVATHPGTSAAAVARTRQIWSLVVLLAVLNLADLVTTRLVMDRGGRESNPVMAPLVDGMWGAALVKFACIALIAVLAQRCLGSAKVRWGLVIVCGWYAVVVAWNLVVLGLS